MYLSLSLKLMLFYILYLSILYSRKERYYILLNITHIIHSIYDIMLYKNNRYIIRYLNYYFLHFYKF